MAKAYDASAIDVLNGLSAIRKRSDMYVGATSGKPSNALFRILREAIDNSIDEYLGGFNKKLIVIYNSKTFETIVIDNGRGIPVGWNEKAGMNALTAVVSQVHAGGKFDHEVYKTSSGKNGVGITALNALSKNLQVWSNNSRGKKWYTQSFECGEIKSDVIQNDPPAEFKRYIPTTGTILKWTPDPIIFTDSCELDVPRLYREIKDIQFLCPGLHITVKVDDKETEYYTEKGLPELVSTDLENDTIFTFKDEFTEVALNFTKKDGNNFRSFVNVCYTNLGGTHLNGLKKAITETVKENSKKKLFNDDILEGIIGAIHHKMSEPQYQGQTKNELTNTYVEKEILNKIQPALQKFFRKNKELLNRIVEYAEKMFDQKEKMKASKDLLKGLKTLNASSRYISDKFLDADRRKYKNPADLEMFIVEGDSAGGHAKQAREGFQATLKIRGKIINAAKASPEELFGKTTKKGEAKCEGNREIKDIVAALGCGIGEDYDESKLRFGKVICQCFTGDTKVKMLDGTEKTFEELVKYEAEHPDSEYWVYSVNSKGSFVPGKAQHPRITGYTKELVEITLDNGSSFKCTPNHKIMLRDGSYKEAKDLETTDSLMPLYTKFNESTEFHNPNREMIFDNADGEWKFTHKLVSNYFNGETKKGEQIHHIDENYLNNSPENLMIMNSEEHHRLHSSKRIIEYNQSDEHKDRISYLWEHTDTYKNATFNAAGYNGSIQQKEMLQQKHKDGFYSYENLQNFNNSKEGKEIHRNIITDLNRNPEVNVTRQKNKLLNVGMILKLNGFKLSKDLFNEKNQIKNFIGFCPEMNFIESLYGSFETYLNEINNKLTSLTKDALNILANKKYGNADVRIKSNVNTKKNGMAKIGKTVYEKGLELNAENYMAIRKELGSVRVPKYENLKNYFESEDQFKEYCKNYNHKIISKKFISFDVEIPVYDFTVETYHNFLLGGNSDIICHQCDSDVDGQHITNLITAFFVKYMPDLIKNGHLYIIDAPLFVANSAKHKVYGMTRKEVDNKMKALKCNDYTITRLKGWGECTAEQLSELCLNPKTRKLIQINWDDAIEKACIDTMGEDTAFRKELLGVK